jgi:hypothetical protein
MKGGDLPLFLGQSQQSRMKPAPKGSSDVAEAQIGSGSLAHPPIKVEPGDRTPRYREDVTNKHIYRRLNRYVAQGAVAKKAKRVSPQISELGEDQGFNHS